MTAPGTISPFCTAQREWLLYQHSCQSLQTSDPLFYVAYKSHFRKQLYFMVTDVLMVKRYAIYFTLPQSDAVYQNATNWLGYDAYSGQKIDIHKSISVESLISNRNCVSRAAR